MCGPHTILLPLPWRLTLDQSDDTVDDQTGNSVKDPDENTDDQHAGENNQRIVDHLVLAGPNDFLQLAAHFAEPAGDPFASANKKVFLLVGFCHVFHPFCIEVDLNALLRLVVDSVLLAESAVLLHLETVRVVLLVLHRVVVSLLALGTSQSDFHAHLSAPP